MLQQILKDLYVDPDLLAELDEEQKQILFCKIRQEQVRRWKESEEAAEIERKKNKTNKEVRQSKIKFLEGRDGQPWVWVMGDHKDDKTIEDIIQEEAREKARKQADEEAELLRKQKEEAANRLKEAETVLQLVTIEPRSLTPEVTQNGQTVSITSPPEVLPVQMRRDNNVRVSAENPPDDIERMKVIRSSQILESLEVARQRSLEEAEKEVKSMFSVWQEQESKAKEAERVKRLIAKRAREDNARATRKMKTESQIIGFFTTDHRDIPANVNKPIPGGTACPFGRPPRPSSKQEVITWYKELEEPRGAGINEKTKLPQDYFHGPISREQAEEYLSKSSSGTFLVRLSDRVWGYALSYKVQDSCKHYLIDASDGRYRFFGSNQIVHFSLDDLVEYHKTTPFSIVGKEILMTAFVSGDRSSQTKPEVVQPPSSSVPEIEITYL